MQKAEQSWSRRTIRNRRRKDTKGVSVRTLRKYITTRGKKERKLSEGRKAFDRGEDGGIQQPEGRKTSAEARKHTQ